MYGEYLMLTFKTKCKKFYLKKTFCFSKVLNQREKLWLCGCWLGGCLCVPVYLNLRIFFFMMLLKKFCFVLFLNSKMEFREKAICVIFSHWNSCFSFETNDGWYFRRNLLYFRLNIFSMKTISLQKKVQFFQCEMMNFAWIVFQIVCLFPIGIILWYCN